MRYIFLFISLISMSGWSQPKSFIIGMHGDTLNRVDENGKKQGRWVTKIESLRGEPGFEEQGIYIDGKKEGTWQVFSLMGDLLAIENFRWGNKNGRCMYFTPFGQPMREESWKAVNPDDPYESVPVYDLIDPTKVKEWVMIKMDGFTLKHGTWKYFDPEYGAVLKTEKYYLDKPVNNVVEGNIKREQILQSDTTAIPKNSKPPEVLKFEKKSESKKINKAKGN